MAQYVEVNHGCDTCTSDSVCAFVLTAHAARAIAPSYTRPNGAAVRVVPKFSVTSRTMTTNSTGSKTKDASEGNDNVCRFAFMVSKEKEEKSKLNLETMTCQPCTIATFLYCTAEV